ncbi:MAG: cation diffusion facilitator family transporter [Coriobacteriia bacterium]
MPSAEARREANGEKRAVALASVGAAVLLTGSKLVVGLLTGSLGILSEALHSLLDLFAAVMTFFAVRLSGRPADNKFTYGYGKVENLSALLETVLLLVTSGWIVSESIQRLFFEARPIETSIWAFAVMAVSIVVDVTRSRALTRAAEKHRSQALEADALHFSTDVWSSAVVIVGLAGVSLGRALGVGWLEKADAVAALGVACIVVFVSVRMGARSLASLLDATSAALREAVSRAAASVEGVEAVERVRVRQGGPDAFVDIAIAVAPGIGVERAHAIADLVELRVGEVVPGVDVTAHVEPKGGAEDEAATVRRLALERGIDMHALHIYDAPEARVVECHVELPPTMSLEEAHALVDTFEAVAAAALLPRSVRFVTHIEPSRLVPDEYEGLAEEERERISAAVAGLSAELGIDCGPHDISAYRVGEELALTLHCYANADAPVSEAHQLTGRIKAALRAKVPELTRIVVHVEPKPGSDNREPAGTL